ncbi:MULTISPECIES: hypothetical protein [Pasteurellaceae]|uniref:Uncharacterized protein n=1 Tax=Pasteurella atlantica TaxID=2827233 RepID=A0AAW8CET3_9PAST|nr:hypothetical protein [Pasteurella atlantica]MBR0574466.1 hypothetical protein [Pasteurella atlantica]MDP8039343.1 hypothetical protein [Pasteurella atlantica]MDP8041435.1 hypothetical protein [Pasteurella atlantica]MDP8045656.1 hypothetical protein [Pasteurella atlantica]MDP8061511.1 hypothetical protein [Pasteurella atlantica]
MVNLTQINDQLEKIPNDQRGAIVTLINIKTEDDMDKVLNRLDTIEAKFESKFDAIETKFDAKFDAIDAKFDAIDAKFDAVDKAISAQKWYIMATITIVGILSTLIATYLSSHSL